MSIFDTIPTAHRPGRQAAWARLASILALGCMMAACASGVGSSRSKEVAVAPPAGPPPAEAAAPGEAPGVVQAGEAMTVRVRISDQLGTRVVELPLDEYVLGAVRAELPPKALQNDILSRLLQVQAVVSRTYALANIGRHKAEGFDVCDSTHCQLYREKLRTETESDPAARAVAATAGQIITYDGRVILALFHSSCGGHTTSAGTVWGGRDLPYLRPVPDWFCARPASAANWEFATGEAELRQALNADEKTSVGARLSRIDVIERDPSGRAVLVALDGARTPMVRAEEFRTVLRRAFGQRSIRSTWFTVTRDGSRFVFTGVGNGHGVGLCQTGASLRAQAGMSPADIIAHYFPGTRLQAATRAAATLGPVAHVGH